MNDPFLFLLDSRQTVPRYHFEHGAHAEHVRRRRQGEEEKEEDDPESQPPR